MRKTVDQALHKREGVVLWTSLEDHKTRIFGNAEWAERKFLPGSLFKLLTAQAALENGLNPTYRCTGRDRLGGKARHCWTYKGHGPLDLPQALGLSCNLYFENLGLQLGLEKMLQTLRQYPALSASWNPAAQTPAFDLPRFAIGDEAVFQVSPLQMDAFWNQYVQKIQEAPYNAIFQGLKRTVQAGTASKLRGTPLEILAKTGTGDALSKNYKTNGWFLGAYPAQAPRYTLLILIQEAHGFDEAAGLAQKIFSKLAEFEVGEL